MDHEWPTTSFTPEQRKEVDDVLELLTRLIMIVIEAESTRIKALDKRPNQVWSKENPDVLFQYVAQGMLEDLIAVLQDMV